MQTFTQTPIIARKMQMLLNGLQEWRNNYIDNYIQYLDELDDSDTEDECPQCGNYDLELATNGDYLCYDCEVTLSKFGGVLHIPEDIVHEG
tara:strand:- start:290 stop:562 length:273 start_codon:yes stop_codon:yes gene_type:complete